MLVLDVLFPRADLELLPVFFLHFLVLDELVQLAQFDFAGLHLDLSLIGLRVWLYLRLAGIRFGLQWG